jgi:hypothetical protein
LREGESVNMVSTLMMLNFMDDACTSGRQNVVFGVRVNLLLFAYFENVKIKHNNWTCLKSLFTECKTLAHAWGVPSLHWRVFCANLNINGRYNFHQI